MLPFFGRRNGIETLEDCKPRICTILVYSVFQNLAKFPIYPEQRQYFSFDLCHPVKFRGLTPRVLIFIIPSCRSWFFWSSDKQSCICYHIYYHISNICLTEGNSMLYICALKASVHQSHNTTTKQTYYYVIYVHTYSTCWVISTTAHTVLHFWVSYLHTLHKYRINFELAQFYAQ